MAQKQYTTFLQFVACLASTQIRQFKVEYFITALASASAALSASVLASACVGVGVDGIGVGVGFGRRCRLRNWRRSNLIIICHIKGNQCAIRQRIASHRVSARNNIWSQVWISWICGIW